VLDDPTKDMEKRIKFCQKSIDFLISLAPHIEQIHPMAADFPEECLMALVCFLIYFMLKKINIALLR